jgi:hypothetical protein
MQALKVLVVLMGLLIVAGVAIIGWTVYSRTSRMVAAKPAADFAGDALPIPPGCRLGQMESAEGRIWLRLEGGPASPNGACDRLLVLDAATGKLIGELAPAASP